MGIGSAEEKKAIAGPYRGELGWEIMTWVPYLRKRSREYDKMFISTFPGMEALYTGFHCEVVFRPHAYKERLDDWVMDASTKELFASIPHRTPTDDVELDSADWIDPIKEYRVEGEYIRYGAPVIKDVGVLFHARGIEKGAYKNWPRVKWEKLAEQFPGAKCIGSVGDMNVTERLYNDYGLEQLVDVIASAAVVIGGSSGVMHLAVMCGTPIVTWGKCDNFGDTLKNRYMETWNPFHTSVTWVGDTWDPEPEQVLEAIRPTVNIRPPEKVLRSIHDAVESGHYLVAVAYAKETEGKMAIFSTCEAVEFPDMLLDKAYDDIGKTIKRAIAQAQAERRPASWV